MFGPHDASLLLAAVTLVGAVAPRHSSLQFHQKVLVVKPARGSGEGPNGCVVVSR